MPNKTIFVYDHKDEDRYLVVQVAYKAQWTKFCYADKKTRTFTNPINMPTERLMKLIQDSTWSYKRKYTTNHFPTNENQKRNK